MCLQEEAHSFKIQGMGKPSIMFVHGVDDRVPNVESLAEKTTSVTEEEGKVFCMQVIIYTV